MINWWVLSIIGLIVVSVLMFFGQYIGWEAAIGAASSVILILITVHYSRQTYLMQKAKGLPQIELRDVTLDIKYVSKEEDQSDLKFCHIKCELDNKNMAKGIISDIQISTRTEGEQDWHSFPLYRFLYMGMWRTSNFQIPPVDGTFSRTEVYDFTPNLDNDTWDKIRKAGSSLEWCLSYYDVILGKRRKIKIDKEKVSYSFEGKA